MQKTRLLGSCILTQNTRQVTPKKLFQKKDFGVFLYLLLVE